MMTMYNQAFLILSLMASVHLKVSKNDIINLNSCAVEASLKGFGELETVGIFQETDVALLSKLNYKMHSVILFGMSYNNTTFHCNDLRNYILHIKNKEDLEVIKVLKDNNPCWDGINTKFIIKIHSTRATPHAISEKLWQYDIINVVMLFVKGHEIEVITYFPYPNFKLDMLDSCSFGVFKFKVNLFPVKIPQNFSSLPVNVGFVSSVPLAYKDEEKFKGFEINIIKTISPVANFLPKFLQIQSYNELFQTLMQGKNDIGLRMAVTRDRYITVDTCYPHQLEKPVCCVRKANLIDSWRLLYLAFDLNIWIGVIVIYVTYSMLIWSFGQHTTPMPLKDCFLNTFRLLICNPIKDFPKGTALSRLFLWWMIFSYIVSTMYQSRYVSYLINKKYEHQVDSIEDIISREIEIAVAPGYRIYWSGNDSKGIAQLITKSKNWLSEGEVLKAVINEKDIASLMSEVYTKYFINKKRGRFISDLHCFYPTSIEMFTIAVMTRKGFPLKERLCDLICRVLESGLMTKWRKDIVDSPKDLVENKLIPTDIDSMKGPFLILIVGNMASTFVFIFELIRRH